MNREIVSKALDASIERWNMTAEERKPMHLTGPFTGALVYSGFGCTPEHRQAVQEAYNSLPETVRHAFEATGFHIEAVGTSLDMAARLDCKVNETPPLALGVTNYADKLVMVAEYAVGPAPDAPDGKVGLAVGAANPISKLSGTLAHEIGHVLDKCAPEPGVDRDGDFIKMMAADVTHALYQIHRDGTKETDYRLPQIANSMEPAECFAESFAYAIGFGGQARGEDYAALFPKCIKWVRG